MRSLSRVGRSAPKFRIELEREKGAFQGVFSAKTLGNLGFIEIDGSVPKSVFMVYCMVAGRPCGLMAT